MPVIFWDSFEDLKEDLRRRIVALEGLPQYG